MDAGDDLSFDGVGTPIKPFTEMNAAERKEFWSDEKKLMGFFNKVMPMLEGACCAVCDQSPDSDDDKRCITCGIFFHAKCLGFSDERGTVDASCLACREESPDCFMCLHPNSISPLVRARAAPKSMKKWEADPSSYEESIFKTIKFCHALCGLWNPNCKRDTDMTLDCSRITMSNGQDLMDHRHPCMLCGRHDGAKVICHQCPKSSKWDAKKYYHVTCARQAGLQVNVDDAGYHFKCFEHVQCIYVFRAFLEDLKQIEIDRSPNEGSFEPTIPITWDHASHLLNFAVCIMRTLGWAWRWAEWWIKFGDNWEPLVEDLDAVASMTNEELKIVRSTAQTRSVDARNCHLAALGAALRNREYDTEDGGIDQESLERALAHLLDTESLVGPLTNDEIDFFTTWLILAYRSESPLLGFGNDKIPVAAGGSHLNDGSTFPESELGSRPLPGKLESNTVMPQNVAGRKSSGKRKNEDGPVTTALSTSSCEQGCEAGSSKARSVETDSGCKRGSGTRLTTPAAQSGSKSNKNARKACEPKTLVNSTPPLQNQHKKGRRQGAKSAVHESDETIHAQNKTSGTSRQNIPSEQPSPASQQIHHVAFEGSGNDATTTPINGTQAKSLSIGCKFDLLELGKDAFIAINGQDGFNSKVSDLCDLLVAELAYEDNELSNQAFDLLQRYRVEYINKRGHNLYLTNVANFLDKLRLHDSYDSTKLVGFLDKVLEVHYDDINFIDQSFELLANNKVAYERTNALDKYNSKIAGLVDKLLEGEVDHDNDEIMTLKFSLLRRHKTAYVAANGGDSYDINVEAYMRRVI